MAGKQNKTNSVDLVKAKCFFFFATEMENEFYKTI